MDKSQSAVSEKLQNLGYFRYAADKSQAIAETFENYDGSGELNFSEGPLNRVISVDAESLFESGGLQSHLEDVLPLLGKMGISLKMGEVVEEFGDDAYEKRSVVLNGKEYDLAPSGDWGESFEAFVILINGLLHEHGSRERLYGLFMDETSTLIFLDEPLFRYLQELIPEGAEDRPLDLG